MASAIAKIQHTGTKIALPLINEANFGFKVDVGLNQIYFSLKAMNGIGTDVVQTIIAHRPYTSFTDFCDRMITTGLVKNKQMIQLIKGGCFTELHNKDRSVTMKEYLEKYVFTPCDKLTMQQFNKMKELGIIPEDIELAARIVNYKKYVLDASALVEKHIDPSKKRIPKRGYHDGYYVLDAPSQAFFIEHFSEESVVDVRNEYYVVSEKQFTKEADKLIQPLKDWMVEPKTLEMYNAALFDALYQKHAAGTQAKWSMQSLCYYDQEHELANVKEEIYGIVNFYELPEEPEPYAYYTRYINGEPKKFPKHKISRIAGTVLNADNQHHIVTLLTTHGVVNVKFSKGHYAYYNKRISVPREDDPEKKKVLEESWLKRGSLIIIAGIRRDDQFVPLIYKDTIYKHRINLIQEIYEDGTLLLQSERISV